MYKDLEQHVAFIERLYDWLGDLTHELVMSDDKPLHLKEKIYLTSKYIDALEDLSMGTLEPNDIEFLQARDDFESYITLPLLEL